MKSSSAFPLTYVPVYLGLFASLVLAMACNAFLDIRYGSFGVEVLLWALLFGFTLRVGWRQHGVLTEVGRRSQKKFLILGAILSALIFIPMWGFPRALVPILAVTRAAQNCVMVSRRQLYLGLLVSAVMVMFAATHYRADWTMLFYLVPYTVAVVFTLVADQINFSAQDTKTRSLAQSMIGGQGIAIAAATSAILLAAALLYALTPQLSAPYLQWRYGQISSLVFPGGNQEAGAGHQSGESSSGTSSGSKAAGFRGQGWPSPAEMRQAASRQGMPEWQRSVMIRMADAREGFDQALKPVKQYLRKQWQSLMDWLHQNSEKIAQTVSIIALIALLFALWKLVREAQVGIWILTRLDYLRFGIMGRYTNDARGARRFYGAMERLFELQEIKRADLTNVKEYLAQLRAYHGYAYRELTELTHLFEEIRYGQVAAGNEQLQRMRALYRQIFWQVRNQT